MATINKKIQTGLDDVTLKSLDQSVTRFFAEESPVYINNEKVQVLYASAERWAKIYKDKGVRNASGSLILPLISIRRTTPDPMKERYTPSTDETNITLTKRVSTNAISYNDRQAAVLDKIIVDNEYSYSKDRVVYDIIQLPFPSFVNLDYDITVWTSYMSHQNLEQENIFKEFKGGRQYFKSGDYYFLGLLKSVSDQSNLEDFSDKEKIIRYNFKLVVQAYFINNKDVKIYRTPANVSVRMTETIISK